MTIQDFGQKIGGAKKDLWKARGLMVSDLDSMNAAEKDKFIKKDTIWKKPNYEELVARGIPVRVVYFMKLMRDSLPTKPVLTYQDKTPEQQKEKQEGYIAFVTKMRDVVMNLKTEDEVRRFYKSFLDGYILRAPRSLYVSLKPEAYDCITNKMLKAAHYAETSFYNIDKDIKNKKFCYSENDKLLSRYSFYKYRDDLVKFTKDYADRRMMEISIPCGTLFLYPEEKLLNPILWENNTYFVLCGRKIVGRNFKSLEEAKNTVLAAEKQADKEKEKQRTTTTTSRKKKFVPPQLAHIQRIGDDFRKGKSVTGNDYLDVFAFKGGEFGNWMNEKDRQASLDYGFDALLDLCRALKIAPNDLSLGNRLSIAFGARGSGSALAHYEHMREVINLTKMRGAGSLAHEWAHALDDIVGKTLGMTGFMTEKLRDKNVPESLKNLMDSMKYKLALNDEIKKDQAKQIEKAENAARRYANIFFPSQLAPADEKKKNQLIDNLIQNAIHSGEKFNSLLLNDTGYPEISALSDCRKELTGHALNKTQKIELARYVNSLKFFLEQKDKPKRVKTDFYSQSITFDDHHSKTDNGYWQSDVELFARAFACYVTDKLKEQDCRSDYLSGHSDVSISISSDKDGNTTTIRAFPFGEERKAINEKFDAFFEELKSKEILHHTEIGPDFFRKELKNKYKDSLNNMIQSAKKEKAAQIKDTPAPKTRERKDGQLEFDLW